MTGRPRIVLRVDGKGRVSIGSLRVVSTDLYVGEIDDDGRIILTPVDVEVGSTSRREDDDDTPRPHSR